jgi:hypothetical protein
MTRRTGNGGMMEKQNSNRPRVHCMRRSTGSDAAYSERWCPRLSPEATKRFTSGRAACTDTFVPDKVYLYDIAAKLSGDRRGVLDVVTQNVGSQTILTQSREQAAASEGPRHEAKISKSRAIDRLANTIATKAETHLPRAVVFRVRKPTAEREWTR